MVPLVVLHHLLITEVLLVAVVDVVFEVILVIHSFYLFQGNATGEQMKMQKHFVKNK